MQNWILLGGATSILLVALILFLSGFNNKPAVVFNGEQQICARASLANANLLFDAPLLFERYQVTSVKKINDTPSTIWIFENEKHNVYNLNNTYESTVLAYAFGIIPFHEQITGCGEGGNTTWNLIFKPIAE